MSQEETSSETPTSPTSTFSLLTSRKFKRNIFKKIKKIKIILQKRSKRRYKLIFAIFSLMGIKAALYFCRHQTLKKSLNTVLKTILNLKGFKQTNHLFKTH